MASLSAKAKTIYNPTLAPSSHKKLVYLVKAARLCRSARSSSGQDYKIAYLSLEIIAAMMMIYIVHGREKDG